MQTRKNIEEEFNRQLEKIETLTQDQADELQSLLILAFDYKEEESGNSSHN